MILGAASGPFGTSFAHVRFALYVLNDVSAVSIMAPSLEFSSEVGVGVGDLKIMDDLGASIGLDGDNCQLSQLGIADADLGGEIRSSVGRLELVT